MTIYDLCKSNRKKLDLSIEEFCECVDLNANEYKLFEEGKFIFDNDKLKRIIKSLYIEREDLLSNKENIDSITSISLKVIEELEKGE